MTSARSGNEKTLAHEVFEAIKSLESFGNEEHFVKSKIEKR
jgi:hypothetical protein